MEHAGNGPAVRDRQLLDGLYHAILSMDTGAVERAVTAALEAGMEPTRIITEGMTPGIREVGSKFERLEIYLPELLRVGKAMAHGVKLLEPALAASGGQQVRGTVILGTAQGDIHDIGKNIVGMLFRTERFRVVDLGSSVPPMKFVEAAEREEACLIGVSALMTYTTAGMKTIIDYLESARLRGKYKVIFGGAALTRKWAAEMGADGYGEDAVKGVRLAKELLGITD